MTFAVFKSNSALKWDTKNESDFLTTVHRYVAYNDIVDVDLSQFLHATTVKIDHYSSFVSVQITSRFRYVNSTILYSIEASDDTANEICDCVMVSSNLVPVLVQFLEMSNKCVIVPGTYGISQLMEKLVAGIYSYEQDQDAQDSSKRAAAVLGNLELVFAVANKNLSTVSINVPEKDLAYMIYDFPKSLQSFIQKVSSLNINNLQLAEFLSNGVSVVDDHTIKLGDITSDHQQVVFEVIRQSIR